MRHLMYEHEEYAPAEPERWEILHEELGFSGKDLLFDPDLWDIDGAETHLTHPMDEHAEE